MSTTAHVVVIGAGPVGLTAAAHLAQRKMAFTVLEAGERVGASIREWGHVRLFSPWAMDIDPDAAALLRQVGWTATTGSRAPRPATTWSSATSSRSPPIRPSARSLRLGATVTAVTRQGRSRLDTDGRDQAPLRRPLRAGRHRARDHGDGRPRRVRHVDDAQTRLGPPASLLEVNGRRPTASVTASPTCRRRPGPLRQQARRRGRRWPLGRQRAARPRRPRADRAGHQGDVAAATGRRRPSRRRRRQR